MEGREGREEEVRQRSPEISEQRKHRTRSGASGGRRGRRDGRQRLADPERTRAAAAAGNPGGRRGWLLGTRGQRQTERQEEGRWQSIYRATRALIHFAVVEEMMSTATERSTKEYDLAIPPQTSY